MGDGRGRVAMGAPPPSQARWVSVRGSQPVSQSPHPPAGWYPDPTNPGTQRWWDGQQWAAPSQPDPPNSGYRGRYSPSGFGRPTSWGGRSGGRNHFSLITLGFAAVYLVLGLTTHIVLLGIFPILMAVRAMQR